MQAVGLNHCATDVTADRRPSCRLRIAPELQQRSTTMKKLVLETTAPFQGLPELVAFDEGLFEAEGLHIEWADRENGVEKKTETAITSQIGQNPFSSHGSLL